MTHLADGEALAPQPSRVPSPARTRIPESQVPRADTNEISHGSFDDFVSGTNDRLPSIEKSKHTLLQQMAFEHNGHDQDAEKFVAKNYNIESTPKKEWQRIFKGKGGRLHEEVTDQRGQTVVRRIPAFWPESRTGQGYLFSHIGDPKKRSMRVIAMLARERRLTIAETIAVILYTGPMFAVYNAILEDFPQDLANQFRGKFGVTIRIIISALQKLSQLNYDPQTLYRGTGGWGILPKHFWEHQKGQKKGFMLHGFMSTTSDISQALKYSGAGQTDRPHPAVYRIVPNDSYAGAPVQELSQFPHEDETIFPPRSYIQPIVDDTGTPEFVMRRATTGEEVPVIRVSITILPKYRQPLVHTLLPSDDVLIGRRARVQQEEEHAKVQEQEQEQELQQFPHEDETIFPLRSSCSR
jgi:hypothetical protein